MSGPDVFKEGKSTSIKSLSLSKRSLLIKVDQLRKNFPVLLLAAFP